MNRNSVSISDWMQVRLEEISFDFISGGTPSTLKKHYWDGDIHWMRSAHISGKEVFDGEKFITKAGLDNSATNLVPKNNLLVATRVSLGNVVVNRVDIAISQDLTGIILDKEKINEDFLYYLLKTKENDILSLAQGTTIKGILRNDLKKLRISLPPLVEQLGIVDVLRTVDECIRLTEAVIERAEELKRGLMQQLLTRGIGHTEFKETPIGKIPKTWDIKRIGDFITLQRGYDLPIQDRVDGSYPVIGSNNIVGHHNEFKVRGPGVIVGRSGTLGRVFYYEGDFWPLNTSLYVKKFEYCDRKFAYYFLQHINLKRFSSGTSVPTLNRNYVHPFKVALPPFDEQKKIVEILDAQNEKTEKEQEKKKHLNLVKHGLMQVLLSGTIRVELKGDGLHRIGDCREANN